MLKATWDQLFIFETKPAKVNALTARAMEQTDLHERS